MSANIKPSKNQLHKKGQSRGFLGWNLGPLLKAGLPLMKNVLKPLDKSTLIPLPLIAAVSATDAAIQKKIFESCITKLVISNTEMNDILKIVKSLQEFDLFKEKKWRKKTKMNFW